MCELFQCNLAGNELKRDVARFATHVQICLTTSQVNTDSLLDKITWESRHTPDLRYELKTSFLWACKTRNVYLFCCKMQNVSLFSATTFRNLQTGLLQVRLVGGKSRNLAFNSFKCCNRSCTLIFASCLTVSQTCHCQHTLDWLRGHIIELSQNESVLGRFCSVLLNVLFSLLVLPRPIPCCNGGTLQCSRTQCSRELQGTIRSSIYLSNTDEAKE